MLDSSSPVYQAFVNVSIRYALFIGITLIILSLIPALSNRFRALLWASSLFSFMLFCMLSILGTSFVWKVLPQKPSELSIPIEADPIPEQTRLKNPVATTPLPLPIQTTLYPQENSYNGFWMLFLLGSLLIGSYWLLGQFRLKKLLSTALLLEKDHPLVKRLQLHSGGKAILLYLSPSTQIPFACGMIRPRIVLPTNAHQWSQDRLDMVLQHEYAHIANWDLLMANLARITLVAQWFNPLVWMIYKSFLKNAEKACDDQVLDSGTEPTEYARCLVDFAKGHPSPKLLNAIQFSITKTKKNMITNRIQNILKRKCDRKPIGFLKLTPALIIMACFGLPISIVELRADTPTENSIPSKKDSKQGNPQTDQEIRVKIKILEVDSKDLEELSKKFLKTDRTFSEVQTALLKGFPKTDRILKARYDNEALTREDGLAFINKISNKKLTTLLHKSVIGMPIGSYLSITKGKSIDDFVFHIHKEKFKQDQLESYKLGVAFHTNPKDNVPLSMLNPMQLTNQFMNASKIGLGDEFEKRKELFDNGRSFSRVQEIKEFLDEQGNLIKKTTSRSMLKKEIAEALEKKLEILDEEPNWIKDNAHQDYDYQCSSFMLVEKCVYFHKFLSHLPPAKQENLDKETIAFFYID